MLVTDEGIAWQLKDVAYSASFIIARLCANNDCDVTCKL